MEPDNTIRCQRCGNKLPEDSLRDGICQQCRPYSPTADVPPDADDASTRSLDASFPRNLPDHIGPYKILDVLGEGGMGAVYLAEQEQPIRRKVALKVVKLGMDTKEVIARFESERQALAMMNHPNIAQVHDAGTTERGAPYFVMEHVAGIPITDYCDRHLLSTRERLEIFIPVCQAIQHAHQRGIIHRDIKPSNVLVTVHDGKAVPKIIDFGVAKATNHRLTEKTVFTQQGYLIGTPEYMSPEQAEMTGLNVDTTTDIYSLGVLLYQLLVGALPFDAGTLRRAGYDEIRRIIREEEPPKPTARLSSMGQLAKKIAERRQTDVASLAKDLRGDLDWVTMKAMEKDRTRRYASSSELAADIERHLKNEPVVACPPSSAYRVQKFVRRHRMGVVIAGASILVLIAFVITTAVQAQRVARERDKANQAAEESSQISEFLKGLFEVSDPGHARGNSITAREILDKGADKISRDLQRQPLIQARLMGIMGSVYSSLGLYDQAQALLEKALDGFTNSLGPNHPEVARILAYLGQVQSRKGELEKAKALFERALSIREKRLGPETTESAMSLHSLGTLNLTLGNYGEARRLLERAIAIYERMPGSNDTKMAATLNSLGAIEYREGNLKRAGQLWERTLEIRERTLGPDHPHFVHTLNNIAIVHIESGDPRRAIPILKRVVQIEEKVLGDNHPDLANGLITLGDAISESGDILGARPYLARAVAIQERAGPGSIELARYLDTLAFVTLKGNDLRGAQRLYERSLTLRQKALGSKSHEVAESLFGLAACALKYGRLQEAESLYTHALEISRKPDGGYYFIGSGVLNELAALLRATGREAKAAEMEVLARTSEARR